MRNDIKQRVRDNGNKSTNVPLSSSGYSPSSSAISSPYSAASQSYGATEELSVDHQEEAPTVEEELIHLENDERVLDKEIEVTEKALKAVKLKEQIAQSNSSAAELEERSRAIASATAIEEQRIVTEAERDKYNVKINAAMRWLKFAFLTVLLLTAIAALIFLGYRAYRWAFEDPIIQTKEVEIEKEVQVIPDECTQVRRNGKVYVSCDGVTVSGSHTLAESGVDEIPELVTE